MSLDHLTPEVIGANIDGELSPADEAAAQNHLKQCHACALKVIEAQRLKSATARAANHFAPSAAALSRLEAQLKGRQVNTRTVFPMRRVVWTAIAALILVALSMAGFKLYKSSDTLSSELLDQHLAQLSDSSQPQVLSSDRHTVKPWFQGKLPFSFNLPEPTTLPADTTLLGADLTYVAGKPAALLLFTIHKHHVSVFVTQKEALPEFLFRDARAGFQMVRTDGGGLELLGVSDVNRAELKSLMDCLARSQ
jgi:anti-sigma factor RsiW